MLSIKWQRMVQDYNIMVSYNIYTIYGSLTTGDVSKMDMDQLYTNLIAKKN